MNTTVKVDLIPGLHDKQYGTHNFDLENESLQSYYELK